MGFCWVNFNVKDMGESLSFYQDIVGLKLKRKMNPMPGTEIAFLGSDTDTEIELIRNEKNGDPQYGKDICLGFTVDSISRFMDFLKEKNIAVISGPFQPNPLLKFIFVLDPNGVKIQFVENVRA